MRTTADFPTAKSLEPHDLLPGDCVRLAVDRMATDQISLRGGRLALRVEACVGLGGQARVYRARLEGNADGVEAGVAGCGDAFVDAISADDAAADGASAADAEDAAGAVGASGVCMALKLFGSRQGAQAEWDALKLHANERIVPQLYAFGLVDGVNDAAAGTSGGGGAPAIAMEYVQGTSLEEMMEGSGGCLLTVEDGLRIMAPIVRFAAHSARSRTVDAHRDIKPGNIVIDASGATRLIDFGIAARSVQGRGRQGTYGYAAPEQLFDAGSADGPDDAQKAEGAQGAHDAGPEQGERCIEDAMALSKQDSYNIAATLHAILHDGGPPAYDVSLEGFGTASARKAQAEDARAADADAVPAAGAPGGGVSAAAPAWSESSFRHDLQMVQQIAERAKADARALFGMETTSEQVQRATQTSFSNMDARIAQVLALALSHDVAQRPAPDELEVLLPLRKADYQHRLYADALLALVRSQSGVHAVGSRPQADAAADRAFVDALDYFNAGRYEQAVPIFMKQEEKGNVSAMYYLGVCYRRGLGGLQRDDGQAAVLFSQAARAGNMLAQNAFGHMLLQGQGVVANPRKGAEWIARAAADDASTGRTGFQEAKDWLRQHPNSLP